MKTIGMIGGMSWESTQTYYRLMNQYINTKLGGLNSIEAIIYSINFARLETLLNHNNWTEITRIILELARKVETAGAQFLMMTSNAAHKIAEDVEKNIQIPLLHIVDPTANAVKKAQIKKVGLIGTMVTMEEEFFRERLKSQNELAILLPTKEDQSLVHQIIFDELLAGKINQTSKQMMQAILSKLEREGAEGVILGCTELNLLIKQKDTRLKLFDTTYLHAKAAVDFSLSKKI